MDINDLTIGQLKFVNGKTLRQVERIVEHLISDLEYDDFNRALEVMLKDSESLNERVVEIKHHLRGCKF